MEDGLPNHSSLLNRLLELTEDTKDGELSNSQYNRPATSHVTVDSGVYIIGGKMKKLIYIYIVLSLAMFYCLWIESWMMGKRIGYIEDEVESLYLDHR